MQNIQVNFNSNIPLIFQVEPKKASMLTALAIACITMLIIAILSYCGVIQGLNANDKLALSIVGACCSILSSYFLYKAARSHLVYLHHLLRTPGSSEEEIIGVAHLLQDKINDKVNDELALDVAINHQPNAIRHLQHAMVEDRHIQGALALENEVNSIAILNGLFHIPSGQRLILDLYPFNQGRRTCNLREECALFKAIVQENIPHLRKLIRAIPIERLTAENRMNEYVRDLSLVHTLIFLSIEAETLQSMICLFEAIPFLNSDQRRELSYLQYRFKNIVSLTEFYKIKSSNLSFSDRGKANTALGIMEYHPDQIPEGLVFVLNLHLNVALLAAYFSNRLELKEAILSHLIDSGNLELLGAIRPYLSIGDLLVIGLLLPEKNQQLEEACHQLIVRDERIGALRAEESLNRDLIGVIAKHPRKNFKPILKHIFPEGPSTLHPDYLQISVVSMNVSAIQWFGNAPRRNIDLYQMNVACKVLPALMNQRTKRIGDVYVGKNIYLQALGDIENFLTMPATIDDQNRKIEQLSDFLNVEKNRRKFVASLCEATQLLIPLVLIIDSYFIWVDANDVKSIVD